MFRKIWIYIVYRIMLKNEGKEGLIEFINYGKRNLLILDETEKELIEYIEKKLAH